MKRKNKLSDEVDVHVSYLITKYWMMTANTMATAANPTRSRNANCSSLSDFLLLLAGSGLGSAQADTSSAF